MRERVFRLGGAGGGGLAGSPTAEHWLQSVGAALRLAYEFRVERRRFLDLLARQGGA